MEDALDAHEVALKWLLISTQAQSAKKSAPPELVAQIAAFEKKIADMRFQLTDRVHQTAIATEELKHTEAAHAQQAQQAVHAAISEKGPVAGTYEVTVTKNPESS
jgi:hypothetical protein